MDIMEEIEVIKVYNRNIKRSHSFLLNVLAATKKGLLSAIPFNLIWSSNRIISLKKKNSKNLTDFNKCFVCSFFVTLI